MAKITSNALTFIDQTDSRKLEVYIASNLPTSQIYDQNKTTNAYSPDWSNATNHLTLQATVYLDSAEKTDATIAWYKNDISTTELSSGKTLIITTNELSDEPIISYICVATYQNLTTQNRITFTRIDTGLNGTIGKSAPAVQAQYSVDGLTAWTATLNAATHKYVQYSYDGGITWTTAIKMRGDDGTSVKIIGTAYTPDDLTVGEVVRLYSDSNNSIVINTDSLSSGDSYLVSGYLCVYNPDNDSFVCTGTIQGPSGNDGQSSYVFIRYATDANGNDISTSPKDRTYIGVYTSNTNAEPVASAYTWSKFVGDSAKNITLSANSQVFKMSGGNATPETITVIGRATNTSITTWEYSINGKDFDPLPIGSTILSGVSRTDNTTVSITGSMLSSNSLILRASDGTYSDVFTVYKAFDGLNGNPGSPGTPASMAFLTNENVTFSANASGQITATAITTNVVAYSGTTKVTPTIGTISGLPTGMTATIKASTNKEIPIVFSIENDSTLGSVSNNNGSVTIPVNGPVYTNLVLNWSKVNSGIKGDEGVGIKSVTVTYGTSTEASTQPTNWQSTIPAVADGSYLWTRTVTDYTDDAKEDTVTLTYAKQGAKGDKGSPGTSVTVSSIQYQAGTSATTTPTGTWSNSVVTVAEGSYLWTKTTFSDGKVAYGVAKQGVSGRGVSSVTEYYLATTASTGVLTSTSGWTTAVQTIDASKKYLWNYELITYTDGTTSTTTPVIIGVFGNTGAAGKGIKSVTEYYLATASSSGVTTSTTGWTTTIQTLTATNKYLWNYELITYTDNTTTTIDPIIIGVYGDKGANGTNASLVDITPSALYFKSTTGKDGTFTPDYIYLYPRFQTVAYSKWEYSTNGGTSWVAASGANGLTISTYNSVANTLRIAKTSTLYTDTVTSISFRCVSSNASVYDTVSIAKIYDVVDFEIGGRNLLHRTDNTQKTLTINTNKYGVIGQFVPSTQSWKNGYVDISEYGLSIGDTLTFQAYLIPQNAMSVAVRAWGSSNGTSGSPLKDGNYLLEPGVSSCTFTMTHQYLYLGVAVQDTVTSSITEKYSNCKLERGNKATDWSPAPEDLKSTTFQLYAPKGYLITNDVPTVTLETFAYDGSQPITGATFVWSRWNGETWTAISGSTGTSLTLNKSNVLKSVVYKCEMTYGGKVYTATATVEDKTDVYDSLIHITSKYSSTNRLYWVLYSTVYSEEGERDELLGPISATAPSSPTTGSYWYKVDETNYTVTLMKYSGTAWDTTTDKQELVYDWFLLNDVDQMITLGAQSKVKIVTANDFSRTCSVQCNVSDAELILLTHNNQILTDPSDPIISATAPTNPINGQLWIKTNANGSYVLSVWDSSSGKWVVSEADTQNKVYVTKPTQYNTGDLWIVDSNYQPVAYDNGVVQTYRHPEKTMLRATATSQTYSDAHWVEALKYQKELDNVVEDVEKFKQFMSIDDTGLIMQAKGANGTVSDFKTVLTNTELGFYQGASRVAYINNNQLNISKAEITNGMVVGGTTPELQIGNFVLIQESNGSLSIGLKS